jgi:hypothetical protein
MRAERWESLDSVFTEALLLPAEARQQFVARRCGADNELCSEVLRLLEAERECGEFMTKPAIDRLASAIASEGWELRPGERIGAYTIVELLGAGGAGEVWRARDERLGRDVAIKTLLPHVSSDPDHVRRFAEEARSVGSLNHSNILTVHDVGEHRGLPFLVTECLTGQSLRQRLASRPVAVAEAIGILRGIARGLAAAHARGIVHRDLKPDNVFIDADGVPKILDFGLAKLEASPGVGAGVSHTTGGLIVGTAGYMAPEQVRGEAVDPRTDLFALGVVAYEMLSGVHPFRRDTAFETLQAVLTVEPPDLAQSSPPLPSTVAAIVMRLLAKASDARFQSAVDLGWALQQAGTFDRARDSAPTPSPSGVPRARAGAWVGAVAIAAAATVGAWWALRSPPAGSVALTQFALELPEGLVLDSAPAVAPDGRKIAFAARDPAGSRLFVRAFDAREAVELAGTEGAAHPFWSPDSTTIGYFARGRLARVAWQGGAPVDLAAAPFARGGAWSAGGEILFAPDVILTGLSKLPAAGGNVALATTLEVERGDTAHWWPHFLADGRRFLYSVRSTDDRRRGVYLGDIAQAQVAAAPLFRSDSDVVLAPLPGRDHTALLHVADGRIEMRSIDARALTVRGDSRSIGLGAAGSTLYHPLMLSASRDVLAFVASPLPSGDRLEAVERGGRRVRLWPEPEAQNWPRVSPDGRLLARQRVDPAHNNPDIWVEDLERGTRVRVTTAAEPDLRPVWSPDGGRLAYVTGHLPGRPGQRTIRISAADGTGVLSEAPCPAAYCEPTDWSADGRELLVNVLDDRGWDVWVVATDTSAETRPLLAGALAERDARLSPDGGWIAYVSEESGRAEVSVRVVDGAPRRVVVSAAGGDQPVWRRDGKELFLVEPGGRLQSAAVRWVDGVPSFDVPVDLPIEPIGFGHWGTQYDVSPDGARVYALRPNRDQAPREIEIVIGWNRLLEPDE